MSGKELRIRRLFGEKKNLVISELGHVMAELGADLIKCFYTGDNFQEVVDNTPIPVFTIGAEKLDTDLAVLQKAYDSVTRGARGIILGRNIFMAQNPKKLIDALNEGMNNGVKPEDAAKKYGLK